ncbi:protein tyrosine phosphatase type IVA protein, putative [Entamoeba invadens IP1]|uniref:Protein tyrosine phosphatase type IVA 3 n=1 Tax=Entamoeba invadens IP1 TaxID=370355 RepID=A0A0A1UEK8_ENTIV|nr:protein tyrosine phosphatase type IVA protein, putative [Entamoeba invadens IP1]ELP91266.1 protein tyrosine phosphatase type IVA protein, putative [Entamoeba invadens IP1]|eukprot:XP_004258037.1 protein tyrosine phosphatase type IVA protein, putative [Entamoeba invadens IP1]
MALIGNTNDKNQVASLIHRAPSADIPFQTVQVSKLSNPASLIEYNTMRFLIFDSPTDDNVDNYILELKRYNVTDVVRCCHPSYDKKKLTNNKIAIHELVYQDEGCPSSRIISDFMRIVRTIFPNEMNPNNVTLGVHCLSGIGRAPTLIAIALIELGMDNSDAIKFIRKKRSGAINVLQSRFIQSYVPNQKRICVVV